MFTYRLHLADGTDAGKATYPVMIRPGEEIIANRNQRFPVLAVVAVDEDGGNPLALVEPKLVRCGLRRTSSPR